MQVMNENERKELAETGELRLVDPTTNTRDVAVEEEAFEADEGTSGPSSHLPRCSPGLGHGARPA